MLGNFAHQIQSLLLAHRQLTFPSICTFPSFSVYVQQKKDRRVRAGDLIQIV
jgi:hypothetical protein